MTSHPQNQSDTRRLLAFYEELHDELERGGKPDLARYVARYPGSAEEVARAVLAALAAEDTQTEPAANVPLRLGPYTLGRERGRGGQAIVYEAEDPRLRRRVALKVITGLGPGAEAILRRFRREAEAASRLAHPCICPVFDVGVEGGAAYIAMRLIEGETLADRLSRERNSNDAASSQDLRRRATELLSIFEKTARALHAAHEAGIIHRDVKPANIMITPEGEPVLLDFGLAHAEDDGPALTRTSDVLGTPAYMAPEQVSGHGAIDARTDVWGLGVSLFEAFARRPPFSGATRQSLASAILNAETPDIRAASPAAPVDLRAVIGVALEKDPARRYRSALELAEDLRRVRDGEPPLARPVSFVGRWIRRARRRPVTALAVALVILAIPALGVLAGIVIASRPAVDAAARARINQEVERNLEIGHSALIEMQFDESRAAFARAAVLDPSSEDAVGAQALVDFAGGAWSRVVDRLQGHPLLASSSGLKLLLSQSLLRLNRTAEADAVTKSIANTNDPFYCQMKSFLAVAAAGDGNGSPAATNAVRETWKAIAVSPRPRVVCFHYLAFAAALAGDEVSARSAVAALRTHWAATAQSEHSIGHALERLDPDAARLAFKNAIAQKPDWGMVWRDLLELERRAAHLTAAIEAAENSRRCMAGSAEAASKVGDLYLQAGRFDDAAAAMQAACQLAPQSARGVHNLATVYRVAGRYTEAEAAFRQALALDAQWARSACDLATILRETGRYAEAREMMQQGHQLGLATPGWTMPSARWVAELDHLIQRSEALEEARRDREIMAELDQAELDDLGRLAKLAGYSLAATRFVQEDLKRFARPRGDAGAESADIRLLVGAQMALKAAFAIGRDAPEDAATRAELRRLALGWMRSAAEAERVACEKNPARAPVARNVLDALLLGTDLARARALPADTTLPAEERAEWAALFRSCVELRDRLAVRPPPP